MSSRLEQHNGTVMISSAQAVLTRAACIWTFRGRDGVTHSGVVVRWLKHDGIRAWLISERNQQVKYTEITIP